MEHFHEEWIIARGKLSVADRERERERERGVKAQTEDSLLERH